MTAWTDILADAIAKSGQSGDLSAPTSLLELSNRLDNPLATLSARDTEHEVFAALDEDLGFVRVIRSSKTDHFGGPNGEACQFDPLADCDAIRLAPSRRSQAC